MNVNINWPIYNKAPWQALPQITYMNSHNIMKIQVNIQQIPPKYIQYVIMATICMQSTTMSTVGRLGGQFVANQKSNYPSPYITFIILILRPILYLLML